MESGFIDLPHAPNLEIQGTYTATDGSTHEMYAAPGVGKRIAICDVIISNKSATSRELIAASGSTTICPFPATTDGTVGGMAHEFLKALRCRENEAFNVTAYSGVSFTFTGYIEPVPANQV